VFTLRFVALSRSAGRVYNLATVGNLRRRRDLCSETRRREHHSLHSGLLEVVVGGTRFGEPMPFHDYDGQAICEAPILVDAASVQEPVVSIAFPLCFHSPEVFQCADKARTIVFLARSRGP